MAAWARADSGTSSRAEAVSAKIPADREDGLPRKSGEGMLAPDILCTHVYSLRVPGQPKGQPLSSDR